MNKTDALINEAEIDLRNRCLIKQFQFILAVRKIEPLTRKLKSSIPRRDDDKHFKIFGKAN
jgi:hypothetical protein